MRRVKGNELLGYVIPAEFMSEHYMSDDCSDTKLDADEDAALLDSMEQLNGGYNRLPLDERYAVAQADAPSGAYEARTPHWRALVLTIGFMLCDHEYGTQRRKGPPPRATFRIWPGRPSSAGVPAYFQHNALYVEAVSQAHVNAYVDQPIEAVVQCVSVGEARWEETCTKIRAIARAKHFDTLVARKLQVHESALKWL